MTKENRLEALLIKHKKLDKEIQRGYSNYIDDAALKKMKQEKLTVKQEIERLQSWSVITQTVL